MPYQSFTVKRDKKGNGYKVECRHDRGNGWTGEGTFSYLHIVGGYLVEMKYMTKPVGVYKSLAEYCDTLEKEYGVRPNILKA